MLKFFLCLKYLRKKKIVFLSIIAVALSTALLVTVASLFTGFINAIQTSASDYLGDIVIEPPVRFTHSDILVASLTARPEIAAASPALSASGLLHLSAGDVRAVSIWGINPLWRSQVTTLKKNLLRQSSLPRAPSFKYNGSGKSCFVGIGLVAEPDSDGDKYNFKKVESVIGKSAVLTTGTFRTGSQRSSVDMARTLSRQVVISDIVFSGVYDFDKKFVFMPTDMLAGMLYSGSKAPSNPADEVHIKCAAGVSIRMAMDAVRQVWSEFASSQLNWPKFYIASTNIVTAEQKQNQYITELRKQMGMLLLIFGIISVGVVVLVFCIFYMIVISKFRDIAIIKSIGASGSTVAGIFVIFGLVIGLMGAFLGIAAGVLVIDHINAIEHMIRVLFGLKMWSSSVYIFDRIPSRFDWVWALRFFFFALLASVLGALVPAIVAARTVPAKILRYE